MLTGPQFAAALQELGITHVIYLPDAVMGLWDEALSASESFQLIRINREGEAWPLAFGLQLGGARPMVVIQSTGLFESTDSMRNVFYDMHAAVYAVVGYRNYLVEHSTDTAKRFTEPVVKAWELDHILLEPTDDVSRLTDHYRQCQESQRPGVCLLAEGKT